MLVYDKIQRSYYSKANFASFFGFGYSTIVVENSEIWLRNLKTGENVLLGNGYQPCFSPDGKRIAYVKYSSDAKSTSIIYFVSDRGNNVGNYQIWRFKYE